MMHEYTPFRVCVPPLINALVQLLHLYLSDLQFSFLSNAPGALILGVNFNPFLPPWWPSEPYLNISSDIFAGVRQYVCTK